jgi:hypothetical protein
MTTKRERKILYRIAASMRVYGGSFAKTLGLAMELADDDNLRRIEAAFPELMDQYENFTPGPTA